MACTPSTVFAWIGFILINIAFSALTSWGFFRGWTIGFGICVVYTILLFVLSVWLEKKYAGSESDEDSETKKKSFDFKLFVYLSYALSVIAMAMSGFLLAINVFSCGGSISSPNFDGRWEYDTTTVPKEIIIWADGPRPPTASFSYFSQSGTIIFDGSAGVEDVEQEIKVFPGNQLWRSSIGEKPVIVADMLNPYQFTSDESTNTTCFIASKENSTSSRIVCTADGIEFRSVEETIIRDAWKLTMKDGTVWAIGSPQDENDFGSVLYSVDPLSMETTLRSNKAESNDDFNTFEPCEEDIFFKRSITALFISSLPLALVSALLWLRKRIPTLPITTYIGITASVVAIRFIVVESDQFDGLFYEWWFGMSSTVWIGVLFFLFLIKQINRETLTWCLDFASLIYLVSMIFLFSIYGFETSNEWWRWILINLLVFIPLIFLGIVCETILVLLYGVAGIFMDVVKISAAFSRLNDFELTVLIYFGVFSVSGIILGFVGWGLSKRQQNIKDFVSNLAEKYLSSLMPVNKESEENVESGKNEENEEAEINEAVAVETGIANQP